jgi:hypothetical protein
MGTVTPAVSARIVCKEDWRALLQPKYLRIGSKNTPEVL